METPNLSVSETVERLIEDIDMPTTTTEAVAQTIKLAIASRWDGTEKELCAIAGVSDSYLSVLKKKGKTRNGKEFKAVCRVLRIDPNDAINGVPSPVDPSTDGELVLVARAMVNTPKRNLALKILRDIQAEG